VRGTSSVARSRSTHWDQDWRCRGRPVQGPLAAIAVFFHDLLGQQASAAQTVELADDHAVFGTALAGGIKMAAGGLAITKKPPAMLAPGATASLEVINIHDVR
jgi:hypothetical protein